MSIPVNLIIESLNPPAPSAAGLLFHPACPGALCLGDFSDRYPGRFSYFAPEPAQTITFSRGDVQSPLELFNAAVTRYGLAEDQTGPVPFVGGWAGFLSYDLGRFIERLPHQARADLPLPLMHMGFYDHLLAWNHQADCGYIIVLDYPGQDSSPDERLNRLRHIVTSARIEPPAVDDMEFTSNNFSTTGFCSMPSLVEYMQSNIEPADYLDKVARAKEYILDGDIFEVNLSQRFSCRFRQDPKILYHYLTGHNPAAYAALLQSSDYAIVCASPELFLQKRGRQMVTRPIKGTRPRNLDPQRDRQNYLDLLNCEKDRAELNMIIDLERNDLGRFCEYGSVRVLEERTIETLPTVFHTVATIDGIARQNVSVADILRAAFPGGSITGAPKIRAMEIIDELEPTDRSVYTGSIGWFGVNGDFDLNIAIRTIILADGQAHVQAGGAVVADSDPQAEYDETLCKAAALIAALMHTQHSSQKTIPHMAPNKIS